MTRKFEIREYVRADGGCPFRDWLDGLKLQIRARMQARVARMEAGNLGDYNSVGDGVFEARVHVGPGYRLYFAIEGRTIIVLLGGGDKRSQRRDIRMVKARWQDYLGGEER